MAAVVTRGKRFVRISHVNKVMRNALAFLGRRFRGTQVHASIDGNRVATNDLAVESFGQFKRERGLSAASWTKQKNC